VPTSPQVQSYIRRGPVYYNDLGYATRTGLGTGGTGELREFEVPSGEWSPWYEITKIVDTDKFLATVHLHFRTGGKPVNKAKLDLQVAPEPVQQSGKTLNEDLDGDIVTVLVPGNLRKYPDLLELASHNTRRHIETARAFPGVSAKDKKTTGIKLETYICGFGSTYNSERMLSEEMEVGSILGMNSFGDLVGTPRQVASAVGVTQTFMQRWIPYQALPCPSNPDNPRTIEDFYRSEAEKIRKEDPDALQRAYRDKLYDEPGTGNLDHIAACANCTSAFREFLKQHNLSPANFGRKDWNEINVLKREAATDLPSRRLYYWSIQFRDASMAKVFQVGTQMVEKYLGKNLWTSANFTNGGLSDWAGGLIDGPDWFLFGRERAESMMWSEDWTSQGPEGTGYPVDVLRSAGSPNNLPVGMYLISYDPVTIPLRTYSALMHGAKCLNFYCYGPFYAFADGSVSENVPAQKALAAVTREVAKADDLLTPGQVPSAKVAISYFKSHEMWQTDTAISVERRNTYLALTHENYPVDLVDEPMVEQGKLSQYKVLYLVDSNLSKAASEKIKDWTAKGGILVTCAGAGLKDEFNDELNTLKGVFGVSDLTVAKPQMGYRERYDLPLVKTTEMVSLSGDAPFGATQLPVVGYRETLTPSTGSVFGAFSDGKPAAILNRVGKGQSVRFAFLPGVAYAKDGKPSATKVAVDYIDAERHVITAAARLAQVVRPLECSVARVEANLLSSPRGSVALLANWTMQPIQSLTVTLRPARAVKTVESIKRGKLSLKKVSGGVQVTLPLDTTDMLLVR
ncbi:MAG: beta-galactosidase trimerization domain-containing protein, partial [Armatimonadetes bacterium]|nr:beta-galactosidase trimerization domain-containing protein [Armatimonadota bacterium]